MSESSRRPSSSGRLLFKPCTCVPTNIRHVARWLVATWLAGLRRDGVDVIDAIDADAVAALADDLGFHCEQFSGA